MMVRRLPHRLTPYSFCLSFLFQRSYICLYYDLLVYISEAYKKNGALHVEAVHVHYVSRGRKAREICMIAQRIRSRVM